MRFTYAYYPTTSVMWRMFVSLCPASRMAITSASSIAHGVLVSFDA